MSQSSPTWVMDLIDELIQNPPEFSEDMLCSPIPVRNYSVVWDEQDDPNTCLDPFFFDHLNDSTFSSRSISPVNNLSNSQSQPHALPLARSDSPLQRSASPSVTTTTATTIPRSSSPCPITVAQPLPINNNKNNSSSTTCLHRSPSSSSLTSPLQGLLDQDPSMLLGASPKSQSMEYKQRVARMELVHMLLSCAEKVAHREFLHARTILVQLQQLVSPRGDSIHRIVTYFSEALQARLTETGRRSYNALRAYDPLTQEEILGAYQILFQVCPYIKFAHFTSNQAIFEAFEEQQNVHIVDLEILQGYQWPAFMQALAARQGGPPHLRITGVGMPLDAVQETGKRLSDLARSLHVPFEYHAVGERLENLSSVMLHRREGEALAVNSIDRLHRIISDENSQLLNLLAMIREQSPIIVTLVEQDASHNTGSFLARFLEAMHYYSAIFDSLDASLPKSSPERTKIEQVVFSSEITNIVACEGPERIVRHEKLDKWWKIMESVGFYNTPLSASAVHQSKLLLGLYPTDGYSLLEIQGCLLLGWQERAIIGASAWRC